MHINIIGVILIASAAASSHALLGLNDDGHWSSLVLIEVELWGGVWLIAGLSPRWTRKLGISSSIILLVYDLDRVFRGQSPRPGFGRIGVGQWLNLSGDIALGLLLLYCPGCVSRSLGQLVTHPKRVLAMIIASVAFGMMIDREHVGQYPAVGEVTPTDPAGPIGLRYLLYLPSGYHWPGRRWPLVVFLHGAGAIGRDLEKVRHEGLAQWAETQSALSFLIVAPQAPSGRWDPGAVDVLLDRILSQYRVDPDRVYLTGLSMGGYGTWATASTYPARFAAIAPICGGGDRTMAGPLRGMPTWVFHGAKDDVIPLEQSQSMVQALRDVGNDVGFTVYPKLGHDCWTVTYDDPRFYDWLLAQERRRGRL